MEQLATRASTASPTVGSPANFPPTRHHTIISAKNSPPRFVHQVHPREGANPAGSFGQAVVATVRHSPAETWIYYILGSAIEMMLLISIGEGKSRTQGLEHEPQAAIHGRLSST
jgi:hypothetical protein